MKSVRFQWNPSDFARKVGFHEIDWDKVWNFINYRKPYDQR